MQSSSISRVITVIVLLFLATTPFVLPGFRAPILMAMAMGLASTGVLLLLRAGQVSFGHAMYFAIGAYVVAFGMRNGISEVLLLFVLALLINALFGIVFGALLARYRGIFYGMLNLAFSMVCYTLLMKLYSTTGGSDGLSIPLGTLFGYSFSSSEFNLAIYYTSFGVLLLALWAVHVYLNSPMGHALVAIKTNETRLEYLGLSSRLVFFVGHVFSAMLAGLGGAIAAFSTGHVTPDLAYWSHSAEFVFIAILGGIGSIIGAVVGAISIEVVKSYASVYAADSWQLIMGIVLIMVVMFAPQGILGMLMGLGRSPKAQKG